MGPWTRDNSKGFQGHICQRQRAAGAGLWPSGEVEKTARRRCPSQPTALCCSLCFSSWAARAAFWPKGRPDLDSLSGPTSSLESRGLQAQRGPGHLVTETTLQLGHQPRPQGPITGSSGRGEAHRPPRGHRAEPPGHTGYGLRPLLCSGWEAGSEHHPLAGPGEQGQPCLLCPISMFFKGKSEACVLPGLRRM